MGKSALFKHEIMIDIAEIKIKAGNGGDGKVSFRRLKFIPKGGPDGGDGGNGGSVYIMGDTNMATLADFRSKPSYQAVSGAPGGANNMTGESGEDLPVKVPLGTLVYDDSGRLLADITERDQKVLVAHGGIGGKGNTRFKSSTNVTPIQYTPGTSGRERILKLEIKLIADVGLVGVPNAGKSTLLNQLTRASAKVGAYPFTTLSPNLGVCDLKSGKRVVVADIPGLIEGASTGKGLGDEFLRHVERTRILLYVLDPSVGLTGDDNDLIEAALKSYSLLRKEIEDYRGNLENKAEIIVINKLDITEVSRKFDRISTQFEQIGKKVFGISAVTGKGVNELKQKIMEEVNRVGEPSLDDSEGAKRPKPVKMYDINTLPNRTMVFGQVLEREGAAR